MQKQKVFVVKLDWQLVAARFQMIFLGQLTTEERRKPVNIAKITMQASPNDSSYKLVQKSGTITIK